MTDSDHSLEYSARLQTAKVADYLESLARQLRKGDALVAARGDSMVLRFPRRLKLEVKAESSPDGCEVTLALSWKRAAARLASAPPPPRMAETAPSSGEARAEEEASRASPGLAALEEAIRRSEKPWLVAWGWESTIDHRIRVSGDEWDALDIPAGDFDTETRVSPREFERLKERVEGQLGRPAATKPGGSPLLSAIAARELGLWNSKLPLPESRFWGIYPPEVGELLNQRGMADVALEYGSEQPSIRGSLCIEAPSLSVKRMYAVFQGRQLTASVLGALNASLSRLLADAQGKGIVLGLGGLNKSSPARLRHLVERFRSESVAPRIVFIATNSFAGALLSDDRDALMQGYLDLLREADVVSLSAEEVGYLGHWLKLSGSNASLYEVIRAMELPGLAVCHHRSGAVFLPGSHAAEHEGLPSFREILSLVACGMAGYLESGVTSFERGCARSESGHDVEFEDVFGLRADHPAAVLTPITSHEGKADVTGLGSRFDGYLSALLPSSWTTGKS